MENNKDIIHWTLEKRKISDLSEYAKNPRRLSKFQADHLRESLNKFGQCDVIQINLDNIIIGGHQRVRTLKKMGAKYVDVYVPSRMLDDKEVEELCIRLNKNKGEFDDDMLANMWDLPDLLEWGFTQNELHLESIPDLGEGEEEKEQPSFCSMNIKFSNPDHLQEAENRISTIIDEYKGATYKVKVK